MIAATLLSSCTKADLPATADSPTGASTTTGTVVQDGLLLVSDTDNDYTIIRAEYAETYEVTAAKNLNVAFMDKFEKNWPRSITDDFVKGKKGEVIENDSLEILVGYTNRKESRDVYESLGNDEYKVCTVNNKIVIIGKNQYATLKAMDEFIAKYVTPAQGETFSVPEDILMTGVCDLRKIPIHDQASYRIMTYNLGCAVGVAEDATELLLRYLPDIIGFQEANQKIHTTVINTLPENYKIANEFHSNGKTCNYTPIVYNSELFTLKDSAVEWLVGRYTGTNTKSIAWALFEDRSGEQFAVINFHGAVCSASYKGFENMTSEERNQQALEWRIDNVRQVIEIKDRITSTYGNIPVMVLGDYNFNSTSQPYKNLTNAGFTEAENIARESRLAGYKSYYSYGSATALAKGNSIDHIFQINNVDFVVHNIAGDEIAFTASDHMPVYADFNIKKK